MRGQYPSGLILDKSIPEQIQIDLLEAYNCLAIKAANASVMMSRRVVQQIALNFNIREVNTRTPLSLALNKLKENGLIDNDLHEALIEVKNWGDGGAHPGKFGTIDIDEARKVVELVTVLVKRIFPEINPRTTVDYLRERRQGKSLM